MPDIRMPDTGRNTLLTQQNQTFECLRPRTRNILSKTQTSVFQDAICLSVLLNNACSRSETLERQSQLFEWCASGIRHSNIRYPDRLVTFVP
jgi:hypothetical protein